MAITIERNKKIQNLQIIENIYIYVCVCVCVCARARVCNYTIEKYKKNMCYHQKNNSNETKQNVYDYTIEKYKNKKLITFKRIMHGIIIEI